MKVSVIIASRNEVPMLNICIRSAIEEMKSINGDGQVVVVDNSDEEYREAVKSVCPRGYIREGKLKLIFQDFPSLFTARERAAKEADGEYIINTDAHALFGYHSIRDALGFMKRHRLDKVGFGHMPVNWAAQHESAGRHDMRCLHGTWKRRYKCERLILGKGMPWIANRDWFLNTLNGYGCLSEHQLSWGGGDMYLWLKTWLIGYESWSIPCSPVIHIGPYPTSVRNKFHTYRTYAKSGATRPYLGYVAGLIAMGGEKYLHSEEMKSFLQWRFKVNVDEVYEEAAEFAKNDKAWFDKHKVMTFEELEAMQPWADTPFTDALEELAKDTDTRRSIRHDDWALLESFIDEHNIKTVLEFGAGVSSMMFDRKGLTVESYETNQDYIDKVASKCKRGNVTFHLWGHVMTDIPHDREWDLALIDGENPRRLQMQIANKNSKYIAIHDWRQYCNDIKNYMYNYEEVARNQRTKIFGRKDG